MIRRSLRFIYEVWTHVSLVAFTVLSAVLAVTNSNSAWPNLGHWSWVMWTFFTIEGLVVMLAKFRDYRRDNDKQDQ